MPYKWLSINLPTLLDHNYRARTGLKTGGVEKWGENGGRVGKNDELWKESDDDAPPGVRENKQRGPKI